MEAKIIIKHAVLIALGDELLSGIRREGNHAWLAGKLSKAGWKVDSIEILPDGPDTLKAHLNRWVGRADLLVLSGGLGPTHDDCTRDALAAYLGVPLEVSHEAYDKILARYGEEMRDSLEKSRAAQASIPLGVRAVHNPAGSALGMAVEKSGTAILALPGVPGEFRAMVEQELGPQLALVENGAASLLIAGWAESLLKDRLAPVIERPELHISILPSPGLIEFYIRGAAPDVLRAEKDVRALLPDDCLPRDARSLEEAVIKEALKKEILVACAESCTGGMIASALTEIPGSSGVFLGCAVCYSNKAKKRLLSVSESTLENFGAVSSQCAAEMAQGAKSLFDANITVSVTGIAGPDGGDAEKPVGTVWFGLTAGGETKTIKRLFPGDRAVVRKRAAMFALDQLWRALKESSPENGTEKLAKS